MLVHVAQLKCRPDSNIDVLLLFTNGNKNSPILTHVT